MNGHECTPYPGNLRAGDGLCGACHAMRWDRFYVVADPAVQRVKLGVTSVDFRGRLGAHRRDGYVEVIRTIQTTDAADLERAVLATLRLAEIPPVRGREYYGLSALPVILDVVDHWEPLSIAV